MASLLPSPSVIVEAKQLILSLKSHSDSQADPGKNVAATGQAPMPSSQGPGALMFQTYPFQILPALNMMSDFRVFDAVPLEASIFTQEVAAVVQLDANILSTNTSSVLEALGGIRQEADT